MTTLAQATVPGQISYQGRLLKADGTPENGVLTLHFAVYADSTTTTELWGEDQSVALSGGYYAVSLGSVTAIPTTVFDGNQRFLGVTIGSNALTPRQPISSVPYAMVANSLVGTGDTLNLNGYAVATPQISTKGPALFYFREAEDLSIQNGGVPNNAVIASDPSASGGKCYSLQGNALLFGPYMTLPPGNYRASYRVKVTDNSYQGAVFNLTTNAPAGVVEWTGARDVRASDFHMANGWQTFSIPFSMKAASASNLEIYLQVKNHVVFVDYLMITPDSESVNNGPWKWGVQVDNSAGWQTTGEPATYANLPPTITFTLPHEAWVEARCYGSVFAMPNGTAAQNHILLRVSIDGDSEVSGHPDHSTVMNAAGIWHTGFSVGRWVKLDARQHTATLQGYVSPAGSNVRFDGNDTVTCIVDAVPTP